MLPCFCLSQRMPPLNEMKHGDRQHSSSGLVQRLRSANMKRKRGRWEREIASAEWSRLNQLINAQGNRCRGYWTRQRQDVCVIAVHKHNYTSTLWRYKVKVHFVSNCKGILQVKSVGQPLLQSWCSRKIYCSIINVENSCAAYYFCDNCVCV